jgi:hypothetical protein
LCNIPSCTNLHTRYSSCWVLEISYHIPSMVWKVINAYNSMHLSNILVYQFEYITTKWRKCMLKVSFSQARVFSIDQWSGEWPHFMLIEWDIRCPSFCRRSQLPATYSTIFWFVLHYIMYHCSQNMSTRTSQLNTTCMSSGCSLCSTQQCRDYNSRPCDNGSRTTTGKDSPSGIHANQYHLPHGYGYSPSQQPFPGTLQCYLDSPFNMRHNSMQPATSPSQQFPSCWPLWQGYDFHQGGYGASQMFPLQPLPGQGPASPGALRVPDGLQGCNPANWPTSSSSTPPPETASGNHGNPSISHPMNWSLLLVDLWKPYVARIADLPLSPLIS